MPNVLIVHRCGCAYVHRDVPDMPPRELEAHKARLAELECPLHWSGSEEEYRAAWADDSEGGGA